MNAERIKDESVRKAVKRHHPRAIGIARLIAETRRSLPEITDFEVKESLWRLLDGNRLDLTPARRITLPRKRMRSRKRIPVN